MQVVWEFDESSSIAALANSMENTVWPGVKARVSASCNLQQIQVGDSVTGETVIVNDNGDASTNVLPPTVALLVTKSVAGARDGRFFWPGIPETDFAADGRLTTTTLPAWTASWDTVFNAIGIAGHTMVVTDKNGIEHPVTELAVRPYLGTQRRRLFN